MTKGKFHLEHELAKEETANTQNNSYGLNCSKVSWTYPENVQITYIEYLHQFGHICLWTLAMI